IVKERRSFWLLREWHSTQPPSRVKPYLQRLSRRPTRLFALPLAVSMEAHYRDLDHACKRVFELNSRKQCNRSTITQMDGLFSNSASI
ncbi:hypothetical protein, partial [Aeromonas hydrophila]